MTTPTTKEQRMSIWDMFRFRWKMEPPSTKQELNKRIREHYGLKKGEHAKGSARSMTAYAKKSDFWAKSKYEDKHDFLYSKREWRPEQEGMLKELSKSYKGRELVSEFNKRTHQNRSYMSVMVRKSKLR